MAAAVRRRRASACRCVQTFHALGQRQAPAPGRGRHQPGRRVAVERAVAAGVDRVVATCTDEVFELRPARAARAARRRRAVRGRHRGVRSRRAGARRARSGPGWSCSAGWCERKGVDELIAALRRLPDVELLVAGGPRRPRRWTRDPEARRLRAAGGRGRGRGPRACSLGARRAGRGARRCCARPTSWCACPGTSRSGSCRWRRWRAGGPSSPARWAGSRTPSSTR